MSRGQTGVETRQLDLFGSGHRPEVSGEPGSEPRRRGSRSMDRPRQVSRIPPVERAARLLDGHDDYRVLRRLRPRVVVDPRPLLPGEREAVIVDTETTGLDHRHDVVIELGMVRFIHDEQGSLIAVTGVFNALQEPARSIPSEITRLTGITDAMVEGQCIDLDAVESFIAGADLVIAHNAGFDRPFCERLARGFDPKPWACSVRDVDWTSLGYEGSKLGYLVGQSGWFHQGHRAVDDCHALLEVLMACPAGREVPALCHLLAQSAMTRVRIWAEGAPFELKDQLKRRGYRWDSGGEGRPRSWWVEVDEALAEAEIGYLEQEIYMRRVRPRAQRITACERYKSL